MAIVSLINKGSQDVNEYNSGSLSFKKGDIAVCFCSAVENGGEAGTASVVGITSQGGTINFVVQGNFLPSSYLRFFFGTHTFTSDYTGSFYCYARTVPGANIYDNFRVFIYKVTPQSGDLTVVSTPTIQLTAPPSSTDILSIPNTRFNDVIVAGGSHLNFFDTLDYINDTDTTDGSWSAVQNFSTNEHPRVSAYSQYKITTGASTQNYGGSTNSGSIVLAAVVVRETVSPYWGVRL